VVIWKLTARRNFSESLPERRTAGRYLQADNSFVWTLSFDFESSALWLTVQVDNEVES
jgi:hypothetical protein